MGIQNNKALQTGLSLVLEKGEIETKHKTRIWEFCVRIGGFGELVTN